MHGVMPSQIVAAIERWFPALTTTSTLNIGLHSGQLDQLMGVVSLVRQVPDDLLSMIPADTFTDMQMAMISIEQQNEFRISRGHSFSLAPLGSKDLIRVIYDAIKLCPDEYPPPSTTELSFISDVEFRDSVRRDVGAANRAIHNSEWKAATVLAGSAIEALLLWKLDQQLQTQIDAAVAALVASRIIHAPSPDRDRWTLEQYIAVADQLGLIKPDTVTAAKLTQNFRNLIHPGKAARLGQSCNRGTAFNAIGALEHVTEDLT